MQKEPFMVKASPKMTLLEKAKTTKQFCDELSPSCILDCPLENKLPEVNCSICEKEEWVRLEDAQKALNISDDLTARLMKILERKDKECGEWKQKLQQLVDELGHRPSEKGAPYSTYQEGWLDGMVLAVQKLEELLK